MLIQACLNGGRMPGEVASLPVTPDQLARAAADAVRAGAASLHLHPRRSASAESLAPDDIAAALEAIRARCPAVPVGVSTGAWIEPDPQRRLALLAAWRALPDFVSVNFSEEGALDVCAALLTRGVGIEAGLGLVEDARLLAESGFAPQLLRVLIEPPDATVAGARETARAISATLDANEITAPRLLHGEDATAWPMLEEAILRGYDTRVGFEDTLTLPDGALAADNAALVAAAVTLARRAGRTA